MEPTEDPPLVATLRSLLNRSTRIEITDGRVFVGQFMCIDHSKNIILSAAYESRPSSASSTEHHNKTKSKDKDNTGSESLAPAQSQPQPLTAAEDTAAGATAPLRPILLNKKEEEDKRFVGLVMIPGQHIVKAEMDVSHLRGTDSRIKAPTVYNMDYLRG